ncbi:MAG: hypothetical protein OXF93_09070 [Acidobacteria bacterium]|nr:hypothetical protein [Acidobacteriota bacterium]
MGDEFGIDRNRVRALLDDRDARRRARIDARFERAGRDARSVIAQITTQVNPGRIYQWGSLLDRSRFSEISDIDIAVEGLRGPAEFFRTLGIAIQGTTLPVDVVALENYYTCLRQAHPWSWKT